MPKQQFAVIGPYRSGTSFVLDSLRQNPDFLVHGEIFQTEHLEWHIDETARRFIDLSLRELDPIRFVKHMLNITMGRKTIGFKILLGQNDAAFDWILRESTIKKIFVRRPNLLAQFVSGKLAEKTGLWNHLEGTGDERNKIYFNSLEFLKYAQWLDGELATIAETLEYTGQAYAEIVYSPKTIAAQVGCTLSWLGVDRPEEYQSKLRRLYSNNVLERFENPADVRSTLERMSRPEWSTE